MGVAFFWHYQHYVGTDFSHAYPFSSTCSWLYKYGWNFVDFFFVLSGFIFCYKYAEIITSRKLGLKEFFILRLSRLYPLHYILLLFVLLVQEIRIQNGLGYLIYHYNDLPHFILHLFLLQGILVPNELSFNAPSWSISCEIGAYLLFFILASSLQSKRKQFLSYAILLSLGVLMYVHDSSLSDNFLPRVLMGFFAGCLTYNLHCHISTVRPLGEIITTALSVTLLAGIWFSNANNGRLFLWDSWPLIFSLSVYPSVILLSLNVMVLRRLLSLKPLAFLGDISYSLYLLSFPIQLTLITLSHFLNISINYYSVSFFMTNIAITMLFSSLSHILYEKPLRRKIRIAFLRKK